MNCSQENGTAKKEDTADSTAAMTITTHALTKNIQAEKEDGTDSTSTTTTTTATSATGPEWDDHTTEVLAESTAPHEQIYVFEKRR